MELVQRTGELEVNDGEKGAFAFYKLFPNGTQIFDIKEVLIVRIDLDATYSIQINEQIIASSEQSNSAHESNKLVAVSTVYSDGTHSIDFADGGPLLLQYVNGTRILDFRNGTSFKSDETDAEFAGVTSRRKRFTYDELYGAHG